MPANLKERLLRYLETILGERPDLNPAPDSGLPLFLRERYTMLSARLFGKQYAMALEAENWDAGSPGEYAKHEEALRRQMAGPVILVLPAMPSYARNRMVQIGIPFIIPGSQTFLPGGVIDLRENYPQPGMKRRETLSPAAQCTLIYHLLRKSLANLPLKDIAEMMHYTSEEQIEERYSRMTITKIKDELEAAGICKTARSGRALVLDFPVAGQALWELAKPQLASPVRKTHWVRWDNPGYPALVAGMSALSERTMIADDRLPTYALPQTLFQGFLEKGHFAGCRDAEQATAKIEVWAYHPHLLGDRMVDPLSLYLSLQYSADERVHQQLEQLIKEVTW